MTIDGEKLLKLRTAKGFSQEKLGLMCNVNKRTIQRAEQGVPIALETMAFIAEALEVSPTFLRSNQLSLTAQPLKAWNEVVLVPVTSGRRIIDQLRASFNAEISFEVEPTHENVAQLKRIAEILDLVKPDPWELRDDAFHPSFSELLDIQAKLNSVLPDLLTIGIHVFFGTYNSMQKVPRMGEEGLYVRETQRSERVLISLVVVSDTSASHLVRKPDDLDPDEIPF